MILATDTFYNETLAQTAGVLFRDWTDAEPVSTKVVRHKEKPADYEPGSFYLRELPFILALLKSLVAKPTVIVIDGYVHLDDQGRKGLGAHLFDALGGKTPVIGVAKRPFAGSSHAKAVHRGDSKHALFVTAAGLPLEEAAAAIASMSGAHRQPTLLKLADRLSRDG